MWQGVHFTSVMVFNPPNNPWEEVLIAPVNKWDSERSHGLPKVTHWLVTGLGFNLHLAVLKTCGFETSATQPPDGDGQTHLKFPGLFHFLTCKDHSAKLSWVARCGSHQRGSFLFGWDYCVETVMLVNVAQGAFFNSSFHLFPIPR